MDADALIEDYLGRLRAASWPLPDARREELQAEVAEHIQAALTEAGARDEVTVHNVLERLGSPEVIAAAEGAGPATSTTYSVASGAPIATRSWGAVEILAILFLTVGSVILPFLGPIVGLLFLWGSRLWGTREKAVATLIVAVLLTIPVVVMVAGRLLY